MDLARAILWVFIEDLGPHEDLFCEMVLIWSSLEHQLLICSLSSWSGMNRKKVCRFSNGPAAGKLTLPCGDADCQELARISQNYTGLARSKSSWVFFLGLSFGHFQKKGGVEPIQKVLV